MLSSWSSSRLKWFLFALDWRESDGGTVLDKRLTLLYMLETTDMITVAVEIPKENQGNDEQ